MLNMKKISANFTTDVFFVHNMRNLHVLARLSWTAGFNLRQRRIDPTSCLLRPHARYACLF